MIMIGLLQEIFEFEKAQPFPCRKNKQQRHKFETFPFWKPTSFVPYIELGHFRLLTLFEFWFLFLLPDCIIATLNLISTLEEISAQMSQTSSVDI